MPRIFKRLLPSLLLVTSTAAAACIEVPRPFVAEYNLFRNGDLLGSSRMTLRHNPDGTWVYHIRTTAEHGFAQFLGVSYRENSKWTQRDGRIVPLEYSRKEEIALSDEDYVARFFWPQGKARGVADEKEWRMTGLPQGTVDRLLVNLALVQDLSCSKSVLRYPVAEEGTLEWWQFERRGKEPIETPMGTFNTVKVAKHHDDKDRKTLTWFAPEQDWVAARIKHVEDAGEETYTMVLRSYEVGESALVSKKH